MTEFFILERYLSFFLGNNWFQRKNVDIKRFRRERNSEIPIKFRNCRADMAYGEQWGLL